MTQIKKMQAEDFTAFNEINIRLLSEALEREFPPEEARKKAEAEQNELLPEGSMTPGQHIFSIKSSDLDSSDYPEPQTVGGLWFMPMNREGADFAFLFFIHISPELRGSGLGTTAMRLLEDKAEALGLPAIRLHVFKSNKAAVHVYEKLGYKLFINYNGYSESNPGMIMEKIL